MNLLQHFFRISVCVSVRVLYVPNGTFWTSSNEPGFRRITERLCLPGRCPELSAVNETVKEKTLYAV